MLRGLRQHLTLNGQQLSIERWGDNEVREDQSAMTGTVACSLGEIIKPYQIKIYPGSQGE